MGLDMFAFSILKEDLDRLRKVDLKGSKLATLSLEEVNALDHEEYERLSKEYSEIVEANNVRDIIEEIMYWRKANAIHKWFVDNVATKFDYVFGYNVGAKITLDKAKQLRDICKQVLAREDPEKLLPTQGGFFFGGIEYNSSYYDSVSRTLEFLEKVIFSSEAEGYRENGFKDDGTIDFLYSPYHDLRKAVIFYESS